MGARPAGLANSAPASPTSAAPAPPRPAERVEPGSAASGLPSAWADRRSGGRPVSKATMPKTARTLTSPYPNYCEARHDVRGQIVCSAVPELQLEPGGQGPLQSAVIRAGPRVQGPGHVREVAGAARRHELVSLRGPE